MKKGLFLMVATIISAMAFAVDTKIRIDITGEQEPSSSTDYVYLIQADRYSAARDSSDTDKMMNGEKKVSVYAKSALGDLSTMQIDNLVGTFIGFYANANLNYTMTFSWLEGETVYLTDHAVKDVNNQDTVFPMTASMTYAFSVPTKKTKYDNRFEITAPSLLTYPRAVSNGNWGTICFPYKFAAVEGANLYEFAGINAAKTQVAVDPVAVSDVVAGKAYLFNATGDAGQAFKYVAMNPATAPAANKGLVGVFADSTTVAEAWFIKGQQIIPAAVQSSVPQYRAFVPSLDDIPDIQNAPARQGRLIFNVKGGTTELENIDANVNANGKMIINGQLVIVKDGKMFNAQGAAL